MKLAEALVERRAAQDKLGEISTRLQRSVVVQEGSKAPENAEDLLRELDQAAARLRELIVAINLTNVRNHIADGRTIMEAIAHRDVLRARLGVYDTLLHSAGDTQFRMRGAEIRFVPTVNVATLQSARDLLAKELREVDTRIQEANWGCELEPVGED